MWIIVFIGVALGTPFISYLFNEMGDFDKSECEKRGENRVNC